MTKLSSPAATPSYERPPIVELGIGVFFAKPDALSSAHFGRFWSEVAGEFPACEDHAPVGPPQDWATSKEGFPVPRVWFFAPNKARIVQIQANRFYLNWRRIADEDSYPRFSAHSQQTLGYWKRFADFIARECGQPPTTIGAEVLKVSQIAEGEGWKGLQSVPTLFPVANIPGIAGVWDVSGFAMSFAMSIEGRKVQADLKSVHKSDDKTKRLLQLEVRVPIEDVESSLDEVGTLAAKLRQGNETANLAFTALASSTTNQLWKRTT
jgi:uncharacterized protein (TIGR04255 family)